jgi:hypothetical protein
MTDDFRLPEPIMRAGTHNFTLGHLVLAHTEKSDRKFWGDLRELYDRLNFGGTPDTEDQRATPSRT